MKLLPFKAKMRGPASANALYKADKQFVVVFTLFTVQISRLTDASNRHFGMLTKSTPHTMLVPKLPHTASRGSSHTKIVLTCFFVRPQILTSRTNRSKFCMANELQLLFTYGGMQAGKWACTQAVWNVGAVGQRSAYCNRWIWMADCRMQAGVW